MFEQIPGQDCADDNGTRSKGILIGLAAAVLFPVALLLMFHFGSPSHVPWIVSGKTLQIHAGIAWSEDYPACELQTGEAQIINLAGNPEWLPAKKIYGYDGGSSYGNFYLRNGKEVEIALTDETTAVLLPRDGKVPVMIGVNDPNALLNALRKACRH